MRQFYLLTNAGDERVSNIQENEGIKKESLHSVFLHIEKG
jgi:hypothetical protein